MPKGWLRRNFLSPAGLFAAYQPRISAIRHDLLESAIVEIVRPIPGGARGSLRIRFGPDRERGEDRRLRESSWAPSPWPSAWPPRAGGSPRTAAAARTRWLSGRATRSSSVCFHGRNHLWTQRREQGPEPSRARVGVPVPGQVGQDLADHVDAGFPAGGIASGWTGGATIFRGGGGSQAVSRIAPTAVPSNIERRSFFMGRRA